MRKLTTFLLVLVASVTLFFAQQRVAVVIAPFEAVGAVSKDDAEAITELFTSRMVMQGKFSVVEHRKLEQAKDELRFQTKEWASDDNKVVAVGRAVNAQYVVRGQLLKLGNQYFLSTTLLKLDGFEVLSASQEKLDKLEDAMSVLPNLASTLAEKIVPTPKAPSSPLIGVLMADCETENCTCTIEFCEGNVLNVPDVVWHEVNSSFGMNSWKNPRSSGSGNWEIEGGGTNLQMHITLNNGMKLNYRGKFFLTMGGKELHLDNFGKGIRIGRDRYEEVIYKVFRKIR